MRPVLLLAAAVALSACNKKEEAPAATADAGGSEGSATSKAVAIEANSDTGQLAMELPGGIEANLKLPPQMAAKLASESKFDIDGVGTYPGAMVKTMKVDARETEGAKQAVVDIGFTAPDAPGTVADWYEKAFADKGLTASRSGDTLTGTTKDGDAFTLALTPEGAGSRGALRIVDAKAS